MARMTGKALGPRGAAEHRLHWRARLIADVCHHLREGQDPCPLVRQSLQAAGDDPQEREFVARILRVIAPEAAAIHAR